LLAGLLVVATTGNARGQSFQGGIRGAAKDPGGVVPGVEVTITNDATNIKRSTVTNEKGEYNFTSVEPGNYTLKATLQGFKTIERTGLRVGTQEFLVIDLAMEVGTIQESVTVTGQSPILETANASQGTVLDSAALQTLPAPGRNAFMIGVTVPTVIPTGDTQFNRQQDQTNASLLSLGGGTRRGNNYTLDGVPITDMRNRASANPTIEGLEDLKVQVHTYDAEMARTGGGTFNVTAKSGTNLYHGSAFYQTRPIWGESNNYFSDKASIPKPDNPYHLFGGSIGGPIIKNRTFFFIATEDYHDVQTRNSSILMPTNAERAGDFSALKNSAGQKVTIYDPISRLPFPNNNINQSYNPATGTWSSTNRINPVAAAMLKYLPLADTQIDNGSPNYNRTTLINNKFEQEYTFKVEHKFTDKVSLTGFYLYNRTNEPCANYFGTADQTDPNRFADPLDYILKRRPQILALNNTWILSDNSVMALRFGMTRFPDDQTLSIDFNPATLPFSQTFLNQMTVQKFTDVRIRSYDSLASQTFGAIDPYALNWKSTSANGSYSRFFGTHTLKLGGDFRRIAADNNNPGAGAGYFEFDKDVTSSNGGNSSTTDGNAFASFLLGYPSALSNRQSYITLSTPMNIFTNYFGGYVQDDWRVTPNLTLNYGLRLEHEDGLHEQNNNFTVGFNPAAQLNGITNVVSIPADSVAGTAARTVTGGLMYAGVGGNPTTQGNPPAVKWSPRVGAVYSINQNTVLRGGYGIYWAPWNYPIPDATANNYGQVGFAQNTLVQQTSGSPSISLTNPFPNGLVQPLGNSLGTLTGIGTNISYVDQNGTAPRVQQYSADLQRELPGNQAITVSYVGSRGDHLTLGGVNDYGLNVNQLDPKYMALGSQLNAQLPNPFFGNPNAGPFSTQATLSRAQLLRPYPQFGNILARRVTEGKSRYNAAVFEWNKRVSHGWGGRISYTYSVLKDNQVGEGNFYSPQTASGTGTLNAYYYVPGSPYYNPDHDYTYGVLDVPHRLIVAPIVELPFGTGRKWANKGGWEDWVIGGWTLSAVMNFQSGFPLFVTQSDNTGTFGGTQFPNVVPGVPVETSGNYEDRLASADHPSATWLNPGAFTTAPAFTFGNAPRTLPDARTAPQYNTDAVFIKNFTLGGGKIIQLKIEELNLFNRVNVRTMRGAYTVGNSNFGQTTIQAGFMRITQIMLRFQF
jgi:hypothetical protein